MSRNKLSITAALLISMSDPSASHPMNVDPRAYRPETLLATGTMNGGVGDDGITVCAMRCPVAGKYPTDRASQAFPYQPVAGLSLTEMTELLLQDHGVSTADAVLATTHAYQSESPCTGIGIPLCPSVGTMVALKLTPRDIRGSYHISAGVGGLDGDISRPCGITGLPEITIQSSGRTTTVTDGIATITCQQPTHATISLREGADGAIVVGSDRYPLQIDGGKFPRRLQLPAGATDVRLSVLPPPNTNLPGTYNGHTILTVTYD